VKALIVRARMVANVLHLGGRYEGARTLGECADALESLFVRAHEAVAVEKACEMTTRATQEDLRRERDDNARLRDIVDVAVAELEGVHAHDCAPWQNGRCDCGVGLARATLAKAGVR
jgi:hypothetical protein